MAQRIFQTALSLLLISGILFSVAQPAQWHSDSGELQFQEALSFAHVSTSTISADESDHPDSLPFSLAFGMESELEEESDSKKRILSLHGLFNNGEQLVHLINGPPCPTFSNFVTQAHGLSLFLLFGVFRL